MNSEVTSQGVEYDVKPSTDILLDTESTCSVFNNEKMLINIRKQGQSWWQTQMEDPTYPTWNENYRDFLRSGSIQDP